MTFQEQKELEDGLHEYALRASVQDMAERLGEEKLAEILEKELRNFGFEVVRRGKA